MKLLNFSLVAGGLLALGLGFATPASAADGFALASGPLRAGPARDYPTVGRVGSGESLVVHGCLARYAWCDVSASGERGWYPGRRIALERDGRRVVLPSVASAVGLSIVGFALGDYWGAHYRGRSWYEDRRWRRGPRDHRPPYGAGPRPGREMPMTQGESRPRPPRDRDGPGDARPPRDRVGPGDARPPRDRRGPGDARPPREPRGPGDARPPRDMPNATDNRQNQRPTPRAGPAPMPGSGATPGGGARPGGGLPGQPCTENCR